MDPTRSLPARPVPASPRPAAPKIPPRANNPSASRPPTTRRTPDNPPLCSIAANSPATDRSPCSAAPASLRTLRRPPPESPADRARVSTPHTPPEFLPPARARARAVRCLPVPWARSAAIVSRSIDSFHPRIDPDRAPPDSQSSPQESHSETPGLLHHAPSSAARRPNLLQAPALPILRRARLACSIPPRILETTFRPILHTRAPVPPPAPHSPESDCRPAAARTPHAPA